MRREWLQRKLETIDYVTIASEEIKSFRLEKAAEREFLERIAKEPPPERWNEFIRTMQQGDEIWYYTSPEESWNSLCGCAGYAIVRKGKVVSYYNTVVS